MRLSSAFVESPSAELDSLPDDELGRYARKLGLRLSPDEERAERLRRVRGRLVLLERLDREAMLDIVKWARVPVWASIAKEQLASEIADIQKVDYERLPEPGLRALALLREVPCDPHDSRGDIEQRLRKAETLGDWFTRKRRAVAAKLLTRLIDAPPEKSGEYQFLPESGAAKGPSLREEIEGRGIVGSLTNRLRGAADDYVRTKMDEIELRIDRKLDEIDKRLGEWRDREVANRLRIVRITLLASVLVAGLSLAYKYVSHRAGLETASSRPGIEMRR